MSLSSRKQLGRLELLSEIPLCNNDAFYRGRDTRDGKDVGVYIPFTRGTPLHFDEAHHRASQLKHPNILRVRGLRGRSDVSYIVTDPFSGESLAHLLKRGPLALPEAVDFADQIAQALVAAHAAGVIHRNLSPSHVLVNENGDIKVLGFEIAADTHEPGSEYRSPEAVLGQPVDTRSDIFSLGGTLYEMLAGSAPFKRRSPDDVAAAIVDEVPEPLPPKIPAELATVVNRCLAKDPLQRFQSAAELTAALRNLVVQGRSDPVAEVSPRDPPLHGRMHFARTRWNRMWMGLRSIPSRWTAPVIAILALLLTADIYLRLTSRPAVPSFQRLTFRPGPILRARFSGGDSVVYTARFEGGPQKSYVMDVKTGAVRELALPPDSSIAAVSPKGDMLVRLWDGSLSRMPLQGGAIINETAGVLDADFSPNGEALAAARYKSSENKYVVEYPLGHVLVESASPIDVVRVSPDGDHVAFSNFKGSQKQLSIVDRAGRQRTLSEFGSGEANRSIAWSGNGREIWFNSSAPGERGLVQAITPGGTRRRVAWLPEIQLADVGPHGLALVQTFRGWRGARVRSLLDLHETDLSWLGDTVNLSLSSDGSRAFFTEYGSASGNSPALYMRTLTPGAPVRLCAGSLLWVSPDGAWASAYRSTPPEQYFLIASEARTEKQVEIPALEAHAGAVLAWLPGGDYLVWGNQPHNSKQHFLWSPAAGRLRPVSPEGSAIGVASDDGSRLLTAVPNGAYYVLPVNGGTPAPARGILPNDFVLRWSRDDTSVYVATVAGNRRDLSIYQLNLNTGVRTLWKQVTPDVAADSMVPAAITPDGHTFGYLYSRPQSELFLARGLN